MYVSHLLPIRTSCDIISQVKQVMDEINDKIPESFNIAEIMAKVEERTPYIVVAFQECERMNFLMAELKRSLKELELGLRVNITLLSSFEKNFLKTFRRNVYASIINWL